MKSILSFIFLFLFGEHLDRQIRAAHFAHSAADAVFRASGDDLFHSVQFENFSGTEVDTNTAALAPLPVDEQLFQSFLSHWFLFVEIMTAGYSPEQRQLFH
jgi:hypothetical protein